MLSSIGGTLRPAKKLLAMRKIGMPLRLSLGFVGSALWVSSFLSTDLETV